MTAYTTIADKQWKAHADQTRFSYKNDTITMRGQFSHSGDQSGSLTVVEISGKTRTRLKYQLQAVIIDEPQPEKQPVLYQVHCNHIGAPVLLTDDNGSAVWSARYTPFGNADINNDVDGNDQSVTFNLRFPGQYFDQESRLHYNWHRYYDPETGRYLTTDPIGLAGGDVNLYPYTNGNPINFIDPHGLYRDIGGGLGVTAGLVGVSGSVHTETCCDDQGQKHLRTIQTICIGWEIGLGLKGSHGASASIGDDKKPKKCPKMFDDSGWYSEDSGVWGAIVVGRSYSTTNGDSGWKVGLGGGWNIYSGCKNNIIKDVVVGECCND